jgi:polysaccharide export outer membrane protein
MLAPIVSVMQALRYLRVGWTAAAVLAGTVLCGCSALPVLQPDAAQALPATLPGFKAVQRQEAATMASKADLAALEDGVEGDYRIGPGDVLRVEVFARPELSGRHVVGPDGRITVPLIGVVPIGEATREEAVQALNARLRDYFTNPVTTLGVEEYTSNQVTVLGRVERAGVLRFPRAPTLAEVLASAGAMPILDKTATLTRGAIMRGRDRLIWVDLKALLNGDLAYNIRMKKGDVVFIPDSSETAVYVLGAVGKPGSYRLTPRMTLLDAIAQAGGATENANPSTIGVYRAGAQRIEVFDFAALIDPSRAVNYALEDGDVIYLPNNTLADIGYVLRQLAPAMSVLTFGVGVAGLSN